MSTVGELFHRTERDAVIAEIERLYPKNPGPRSGYERAWVEILAKQPKPAATKCVVALVNRAEPFVDVSGRKDDDPVAYGLSFVPWREWLGMTVVVRPPLRLTETEIVAHILWEMTYAGYDEARIQSRAAKLRRMAKEVRRRRRAAEDKQRVVRSRKVYSRKKQAKAQED